MTRAAERLFALVRATLRNRMDDASLFEGTDAAQWREIYDLSSVQGVLAQAWDGMQLLPEAMRPPRALRLQWAVNVERIEKVYRRQERAIARLAAFYREHAIPMMLLKGYGLSLFYPVPEHRPCGDIDIWLFGRQPEADKLVAREWGVPVDVHKEHHTTFDVDGIMVENHYDFVNKETHASNARLERLFKQYAAQPGESVAVAGVAVYLPSEQLNALFLLRHAAVHFAAINIGLRHVLDWCVFVAHCHDRIDWPALYAVARETRMVGFLNCLNALCVDCLGLEAPSLPDFERDDELEKRVLDEILPGGFAHNEQSLRVVDRLEKEGEGLNLTYEVRRGILCHTGPDRAETLEGQLLRLADKIAYINHDIDDAIRGRIIYPMDIPLSISQVLGFTHSERINTLTVDIITQSAGRDAILQSPACRDAMGELRAFMFEFVYRNPVAKGEEGKAQELLRRLFDYYRREPDKLPPEFQDIRMEEGVERAVCDYIAGMTDVYAVECFNAAFIPKSWSVK